MPGMFQEEQQEQCEMGERDIGDEWSFIPA